MPGVYVVLIWQMSGGSWQISGGASGRYLTFVWQSSDREHQTNGGVHEIPSLPIGIKNAWYPDIPTVSIFYPRTDPPETYWKSSGITRRLTQRTIQTASGSVYRLVGELDKTTATDRGILTWGQRLKSSHKLISPVEKGRKFPGCRSRVCPKRFCSLLFTRMGTLGTTSKFDGNSL